MRRGGRGVLRGLVLALCALVALALATPAEAEEGPTLSEAQAFEVMDGYGNVLWSQNGDAELPMASITKVMTAMVALDSGMDLDTPIPLVDVTVPEGSQVAGISSADTMTLRQMLYLMLVYSANDVAEEVAVQVSGSHEAFCDLMNAKAAELGMSHTHFMNPHGMEEDGHYASAHDLVVMGRYALENYPLIANAVVTRSYTIAVGGTTRTYQSTDDLMESYGGLCGIKTGALWTSKAFLGSSKRHGLQLFTCVLGCQTIDGRFADTAALMDWAYYRHFAQLHLARESWPIRVATWEYGFWGKVMVTPSWNAFGVSYPGEDVRYSTTIDAAGLQPLGAPCGSAVWSQDDRPVAREVYATRARLYRVPSFNVFALPLFMDVTQLMGAA